MGAPGIAADFMLEVLHYRMSIESKDPEFWEQRYLAGQTPWDGKGVPYVLNDYLSRQASPGRALIPGCGRAYEVHAFHEADWAVTAFDFSPAAVRQAQDSLGELAGLVRVGDFFSDDFGVDYDLVYERFFLCSFAPSRWDNYADKMHRLLRPGGRLAGIFFYGDDPEPPPFPLTDARAAKLFEKRFRLVEEQALATQDIPVYLGAVRWQVWEKL